MAESKKEVQYTSGGSFKTKIGKTTYEVQLHFNGEKNQKAEDRIKRLIFQDVKNGEF